MPAKKLGRKNNAPVMTRIVGTAESASAITGPDRMRIRTRLNAADTPASSRQLPNILAVLPGVNAMSTTMMKNLIKKKGAASIDELREAAVEAEVEMIACQMTLDLFELDKEDMIENIELGGAATYMERALKSDINLFI
jgi:peroxiredoxin family protein